MTPDVFRHAAPAQRSGAAVWRRIADTLSSEIRDGRFAEGRLPAEGELAARFHVARHTLRQAMQALQDEGLLRVERGRGTFVQRSLLAYPLSRRTRFSENFRRQGLAPAQHLLSAGIEAADARVAAELQLAAGASVVRIESLSEADGQPLSVMTAWYPADRFAALPQRVQDGASTTEVLRELGVADYLRAHSRVTSRMPGDETARLLRQPPTRPLLCVASVDVDLEGRPIKFGETLFCGDRIELTVDAETPS
ncbi:MAG TPA: phosphonate metabolism transcriptional regulator PhnF [Ramlibacter sp.]|uniref:phosphonate metabolism transcriptional regulator PhnF n=1 Tax=Ramlibacter sp. TaxID=1917967 RepID=UPI002ED44013